MRKRKKVRRKKFDKTRYARAVGKPKETLFDKKGSRVIIKLKTKDF